MDKTVGVIGLGYVGLPLALTAAESGWNVVGFDKNVQLIENLSSSKSHIDDVSNSKLTESISQGRFIPVDDPDALSDVDICIICCKAFFENFEVKLCCRKRVHFISRNSSLCHSKRD